MDLKDITAQHIFDYHRELILDDSGMFRAAAWDELYKWRRSSFFEAAYWIVKTLYTDCKTRRFYNRIDVNNIILVYEDYFSNISHGYRDWCEE